MRATDILRIKRLADSAPYNDSNKQAFRRLVRTVKHNHDYIGGHNTYFSFERLAQLGAAGLAQYVQQLIARESAVVA